MYDFPRYDSHEPRREMLVLTPDRAGRFHQFFETSPFTPSGRYVCLLEAPFEDTGLWICDVASDDADFVVPTRSGTCREIDSSSRSGASRLSIPMSSAFAITRPSF